MTKHTMVTLQLHRKGVILIGIGCLLLAVLLVAGGYFAGIARARPRVPAAPAPSVQKSARPAAASRAAASREAFSLRVALVMTEEEARAEVKRLSVKRLAATIVPVETNESLVVYEIHVGRYPDRRTAVAAAKSLKTDHALEAAVIPAEP